MTVHSLYKLSVTAVVNHSRGFQEISWLPRSILFDIMFELYENEFKDRLFKEINNLEQFSKLLSIGNRRACLHKMVQFCCSENLDIIPSLCQSYTEKLNEVQEDTNSIQQVLETGLSFGDLLNEAGYYEAAADIFRLSLTKVHLTEQVEMLSLALNWRLLNSLSGYCLFQEAAHIYTVLLNLVDAQKSLDPDLLCRIYTEFSMYNFHKSEYQASYDWSQKALEALGKGLDKLKKSTLIDTLRQASRACIVKRYFSNAELLIRQAICSCKSVYGTTHAKYADCMLDYGSYLLNVDSIGPSQQAYQTALDVRLEYFGGNNLKVAVAYEDLAYANYVLEYGTGQFQEAKANAEESLNICSQLLPSDHLLLANPKRVLALVLEEMAIDDEQNSAAKMSNLKLAEELHLFALDVTLRVFGEMNVQTAKHYGNLGRLYQTIKRLDEAEKMDLKAIQIKEALLGHDDYEVGLSVGHLASLYNYDMKEYVKAELLYLRSIGIAVKLFGPSYSGLEYDYEGLLHVYQATMCYDKLYEYISIYADWKILKEQKESVEELGMDSVLEVTTTMPLSVLIQHVTSTPATTAAASATAAADNSGEGSSRDDPVPPDRK